MNVHVVERARELRRKTETLAETLTDAEALDFKELFPAWNGEGVDYLFDERVRYKGNLYKCLQPHTSQAGWSPAAAPSLWAKVLIQDPEVIPVWEQPDSTNPYMQGDRVHYPTAEDPVYESLIDNNVWSPGEYPDGWQEVSNV